MTSLPLLIPTYSDKANVGTDDGYSEPHAKVLVHAAEGLRIVLGSHDLDDYSGPDIWIERRPNGWAIILHPAGGDDPCGAVAFYDDGHYFACKETGCNPPLQMVSYETAFRGMDAVETTNA